MRNKERGLHPCRPRSRYLRQRGGRGFDFVGKIIKSEDFGEYILLCQGLLLPLSPTRMLNSKFDSMQSIESGNKGEVVMYQPDETIRLEVRVEDETVWLTQQQIADLFQSSRTNVVEHVMHIYEDEELEESSTCRKFRQVRKEGKRMVKQGKKLFAYIKMQETPAAELLNNIRELVIGLCRRDDGR